MAKFKTKMKLSDYIRLGRISIKSRKKSTKNTVFGMSFGLILLVPMIFFAVAFYSDLSKQINKVRTASECSISLKNINDSSDSTPYKEYTNGNNGQDGLPAFSLKKDLIEMNDVEDYILSEYINIPVIQGYNNTPVMLSFGSDEYNINPYSENSPVKYDNAYQGLNKLKVIFTEESTKNMFTDAELSDFKALTSRSNPLINICNDGFSKETSGKNEIIISEILLQKWGIDKEDIASQVIRIANPAFKMGNYYNSLAIDNNYDPDDDFVNDNNQSTTEYTTYFCYDFKVVGIIDSKYYNLPGKQYESHMWVTAASVYYEDGSEIYTPIDYIMTSVENNCPILTFKDNISVVMDKNIDEQYMFLMQNIADRYTMNYSNNYSNKGTFNLNTMKLKIQFKNYETVSLAVPEMKTILKSAYNDMTSTRFTSEVCNDTFVQFDTINQIGKIIIIVFSAIGGIIFFTNMLNLLNTVRYSVESRKNYIGVMRAIGAKSKVIPKMYIFEMMIIFFKTFIWTAIFSSLISYGIKYGLDYAFSYLGDLLRFSINFLYYPIALGGSFLLTTLIGTFFAYISSKVMAYQPILKTLFDEK